MSNASILSILFHQTHQKNPKPINNPLVNFTTHCGVSLQTTAGRPSTLPSLPASMLLRGWSLPSGIVLLKDRTDQQAALALP